MPDKFVDPYLDPEAGVLSNLVGARTYDDLARAEGEFASLRMGELIERGNLRPTGTLDDFCRIHHALFQDIYAWAGCVRTVEIRKNVDGAEFFLPSTNIAMGMEWSRSELLGDKMLKGLERSAFLERLAYHYDNYNFVHPFREGNGRTQRVFWTLLCHDAGYDLDWRLVSGEENDEASRSAAEDRDYSQLIRMFSKIVTPCDPSAPINRELLAANHLHEE